MRNNNNRSPRKPNKKSYNANEKSVEDIEIGDYVYIRRRGTEVENKLQEK